MAMLSDEIVIYMNPFVRYSYFSDESTELL
jgi:hypothetical protein